MRNEGESAKGDRETPGGPAVSPTRLLLRGFAGFLFAMGLWGGLLLGAAGTVGWSAAWVHMVLWTITFAANGLFLHFVNPAVLEARLTRREPPEGFDRLVMAAMLPATLAIPVVAGLDAVRMGWTAMGGAALWIALPLHVGGDALLLWTMAVNPFLEKVVRIQVERGHRVVTTGPYALVRHPMYLAVTLLLAAIPLTLGSWWTFAPVGALVAILVVRTVLEDRLLHERLPGYVDYARRTRFRLLPGIW